MGEAVVMKGPHKLTPSRVAIHAVLTAAALATLLPFLLILSASFTEENTLTVGGYRLIPRVFSTVGYRFLVDRPGRIANAYSVTVSVTGIGTLLSVLLMSMMAYAMSRRQFRLRRFWALGVLLAMLFSGGLVPYYILVTQYLRLQNTFVILLLPNLVGLYQIVLLRSYFVGLPEELFESARVDGAGEWRILFSLVVHLAKPALAAVGLMVAVAYWNNWTTCLYFIRDWRLYTLQYLLYQVMRDAEVLALEPQLGGIPLPLQSTRMAMAVLATGPAALFFLVAQKHMVRGITLGSLK